MAVRERVTVTLPGDVVREMDRQEKNRSKFVLEAVRQELQRRRREELRRSLETPHPDGRELTESGFEEWARALPEEDVSVLVDLESGTPLRWVPGRGWKKGGR
jgi:hypothetical protein